MRDESRWQKDAFGRRFLCITLTERELAGVGEWDVGHSSRLAVCRYAFHKGYFCHWHDGDMYVTQRPQPE